MEFIFKDTSNLEEKELIELLNHNVRCAGITRREINKLKQATASSNSKVTVVSIVEKPVIEKRKEEDKVFEKKVRKCLKTIKEISVENIEEDIYGALPSHRDYDYKKIIRRVILELSKEINDINEIILADGETISKEDLEDLSEELTNAKKIIDTLKGVLKEEDLEDTDDNVDNTVIFIPTASGNCRIFDDLDNIPVAYHNEFLELFSSIIDGSFKNAKRFKNNNKIKNLREVKGDLLRITYFKLGKNTYGVFNAFQKKEDTSHGYRSMLYTRYKEYTKYVEKKLKAKVKEQDDEFLKIHKDYEIELLRKLGVTDENNIQKVKKGEE